MGVIWDLTAMLLFILLSIFSFPVGQGNTRQTVVGFFPSKKRLTSKLDVPIILVFQAYLGGSSQSGKNTKQNKYHKKQVRGTNIRKEDVNL